MMVFSQRLSKQIILLSAIVLINACAEPATKYAPDSKAHDTDITDERPNVVFVLVDDLGYGQLGVTGQQHIKTPNINALANSGAAFTQAYSGGPVCSPSRISLLTGLDGRGLHTNSNAIKLKSNNQTFAQVLQKAGYDTNLIGKFGVGKEIGVNDPLYMGFNNWYGIMENIPAHRQYPSSIYINNKQVAVPENENGKKGKYAQEMWTAKAEEYLRQEHIKPFFLFLSYTSPHAELAAPKAFYQQYKDKFEETPYVGQADGKVDHYFEHFYPDPVEQPNATMAAMISALDSYVGRLVAVLKTQGLLDNTMIIFTSDNGVHAEGGFDPSYFESSKPYRGIKRDLTDGGIHVPFIVRWDSKLAPNTLVDVPIAFADMLPTFAEMAGVEDLVNTAAINGQSVYPLLTGEATSMPDRLMYWEFVRQLGLDTTASVTQAIRKGDFKAVRYGADAKMGLYKITEDQSESKDLTDSYPELAKEYLTFFDKQLTSQ